MQLLLLACEAETWESQLLCRTVSLKSGMSPRLTHIRCCAQDIFDLANYEYADMIDLTDCAPGAILFSDFEDDCMDILSELPPDKDPEVHHDPMRNGTQKVTHFSQVA